MPSSNRTAASPDRLLGLRAVGTSAAAITRAIDEARRREREMSDNGGWCLWRQSDVFTSGTSTLIFFWVADDTGGKRSRDAVRRALRAEGVVVQSVAPGSPGDPLVGRQVLHARGTPPEPEPEPEAVRKPRIDATPTRPATPGVVHASPEAQAELDRELDRRASGRVSPTERASQRRKASKAAKQGRNPTDH